MAKYRITSIPQSLPQAKKGLTILNKENVTPEPVPVQGIEPSSYWDQMQSPYMTESTGSYGTTQGCPPGKVYGGIGMDGIDRGCVTPQELQEQDRQDRLRVTKIEEGWAIEDAAKQKMAEDKYIKEETERIKKENIAWQANVKNYYDKYKKANTKNLKTKFIKPEPILILSPSDITSEEEKEYKNAYYINKNKKTGKIEFYPREIMNNRIINNGYKVSDFEKWGFDKEQITSEFEPTMKLAHEVFTNTMTNKIVTRALKEGKTVDQVISELGTNLGNKEGLTKDFKKSTEKIITDLFNSTQQNIINSIPSTDKDQVTSGENIFRKSDDPVASWNDANHPNDFAWQLEQFNNQTNALSEYDKEQAKKNKNFVDPRESFGNLLYGDTNAKVREQNILGLYDMDLKKNMDKRNAVGYEAKNKDALEAYGLYKQNFGADILKSGVEKKLNAIKNDPKTQIEFLKSFNDDVGKSKITGENETLNNLVNDEDIKNNINFAWSRNNFGRNDDAISEGRTNQYNINDHPLNKIKDVLYNPIPAFDAWMNPRKTMWGNSGMSYTQREKIKDETGVDMGTINYDSPLGALHYLYNAANPIKVGADVRQGYDNGHFWSSLGESLSNAGMAVAPIKGFNALGNLAKGAGFRKGVGTLLSGFSNPALNAGFALQAPQNFSNAGTNFQEGNYGTAALDALMGLQGISSPLRVGVNSFKTLNNLRNPGTISINNIPTSRFTGLYNAATPGSGIAIGNPGLNTAQPFLESITNPLNKLSKGLGFGEFSMLKQNPGFNPKATFNIGYKKGGSLPKAWDGLSILKNAGKLVNEFKAPTKNILMPAIYQNIANSVYKNPNIQPILDMINPISNLDSQYLLTDILSKTDNPYDVLGDIYNQPASDYNIGDLSNFDRSTLEFANRRNAADALKNLGYVGNDVGAEDLFKMARTNDSMNKIMQLAIDQDRTGYRQVTGDFNPRGVSLDGYSHRTFDMYRRRYDNPRSEVENMDLANVNRADPLSLAAYQATHIPMEQYGYRAGLPDMYGMDVMYLASLPEKQSYGPYQFKVQLPTDFSTGNWQDWYQKYIVNKKPMFENGYLNNSLSPKEIYFNSGQSKGTAGESFNKTIGLSNATGLNTRHWISGTGNKIGTIDPTFKFTDLKNMSTQDYLDMENNKNSIINNFNTGWRGHYKKGGSLPKANIGRIVRSIKGLNIPNSVSKIPIRNLDKGMNINFNQLLPALDYFKGVSEVPMVDLKNLSNTTGGNSLIQYGDEPFQGESFYHADPLDYPGIKDWKNEANIDANNSLNNYLSNKPPYGSDIFKGVGNFNFAAGSDGWEVRNDLSNLATFGIEPSGPQWVPGKEDFYTLNEISNLTKKQTNHLNNWNTFNKMYPENPSEAVFRGLTGDTSRDELFSNLFPNSSIQNFKQKFYRPEHIDLMKQSEPDALGNTLYDNLTNNTNFGDQGMLNPQALKTINTGFETLPKTYEQLLKNSKGNDFLQTGPAKIVVSEMRGKLGLSLEEVLNASPEQLEKWRRQIVIKMGKQDLEKWESDISKPLTVQDAWKEISKQAGYKNKNGGVVTKLSQKEIEEYVKGGYIIEEE